MDFRIPFYGYNDDRLGSKQVGQGVTPRLSRAHVVGLIVDEQPKHILTRADKENGQDIAPYLVDIGCRPDRPHDDQPIQCEFKKNRPGRGPDRRFSSRLPSSVKASRPPLIGFGNGSPALNSAGNPGMV